MNNDLKDRTKKFSLTNIEFFNELLKGMVFHTLGKQILRSGTSVGANTRAAFRVKKNYKENLNWLKNEADELVSIFTSISKNQKSEKFSFQTSTFKFH